MRKVIRPDHLDLETDALPSLCSMKTCLADRVAGSPYCVKHAGAAERRRMALEQKGQPLHVYAIRGGDLVKFGKSHNPAARLSGLQTDSPVALELVGAMQAPQWMESAIHFTLAEHRVRGEWFRWVDETREIANHIGNGALHSLMGLLRRPPDTYRTSPRLKPFRRF